VQRRDARQLHLVAGQRVAGRPGAVHDQHPDPGPGQQQGGGRARHPRAHHDHVVNHGPAPRSGLTIRYRMVNIRYRTGMAARKAGSRPRLTPGDWVTAALSAIAEGGLAAVAVEPLAARLGATKGSFYWHFASRDELLAAALARWERQTTAEVADRARAGAPDPAGRLRLLVTEVARLAEADRVGPALLASAAQPAVAAALERVTRHRLAILVTLFGELGLPPAAACRRALLAYSAYLGHAQLSHTTPQLLPRAPAARHAYLDEVIATLTDRPRVASPRDISP
jgi:AcrR family transcriptional regulator